jgi:hypothetical protein
MVQEIDSGGIECRGADIGLILKGFLSFAAIDRPTVG